MFRLFNRRTDKGRSRAFLPRLEILEDRTVPSTLTVTSNADSGPGSLRAVIGAAHDGDTIDFAHNLRGQTIHLSTELSFGTNLHIQGPGADKLTISGSGVTRVFDITGGTTTIADLTIADGLATGQLPSSLVGTFSGTGSGAGGGGSILNQPAANLTLRRDTVRDNTAAGAVGYTEVGGGLLNLGTAMVQSCVFTNNDSVGGGASDAIGGSAGGAIDNFGGPTGGARLTVNDSTFRGNLAMAAGNGLYYGVGGALENNAGLNSFDATRAKGSSAVLNRCTFLNNLATAGTGGIANAGAIDMEGIGTTLKMTDCIVSGNRSVGGNGGDATTTGDSQGNGGGVELAFGVATIIDCIITDNQAVGGNNAVISAGDASGAAFGGGAFGGGIENNFEAVLNISGSLIADNLAQGGAVSVGPGGLAVGGGISNSPSATMNMTDCIVTGNRAVAGRGGPGVNSQLGTEQVGFAFGGGIDISNNGSAATILDSIITGNAAIGGAGGAGNNGGNGYGGGIGVGWGPLLGLPDGSHLTLVHSIVAGNLAAGGAGGTGANGGTGEGGGLFISSAGSATLTASRLVHNRAVGGGAGKGGQAGDGFGGGVAYDMGSVFSEDAVTVIRHNHASTAGDDVYRL